MPKLPDEWNYTRSARDVFGPEYGGRLLISRDMPVRGGVYFGAYGGEAIVVDPQKYPEAYHHYYGLAATRASVDGVIKKGNILQAVFDTVKVEIQYSRPGVERLTANIPDGGKIELSSFMKAGVGVCRHQALACAALLERFQDEGHIGGTTSVDRSTTWNPRKDRHDGHAWTRYTPRSGQVVILDVAQDYFGFLEDVDPAEQWNYLRPEERQAFAAPDLGAISFRDEYR